METSLSIHPDRFGAKEEAKYLTPGRVLRAEATSNGALMACERGLLHVQFYDASIVRITFDRLGKPAESFSHSVILKPAFSEIQFEQNEQEVLLHSEHITVRVSLNPARVDMLDRSTSAVRLAEPENGIQFTAQGEVACRKLSSPEERYYGFGEKAGFLNKRGERLVMWNTDVYAPHNQETDSLYVSIPYYLSVRGTEAHGILFDNTYKTAFDMREPSEMRFEAEGGALSYYYMAGPDAKSVIRQLGKLTGHAPLPPKWSLGYHQSRYSYETEQEVLDIANTFQEKGIPLDTIYLDIHYMDGYRVFTVDQERFPDFGKLVHGLRERGIRIVTIVDPGVKADAEYEIYKEGMSLDLFCKDIEGQVFHGPVWPGRSAFPDFTSGRVRKWWGEKQQSLTDAGVAGIWNDMNEPSVFNESKTMDLDVLHDNDGHPGTHRELHNVYGLQMARASYEGLRDSLSGKRPFVLTRAGYAGIQRYAAVWTGDNRSFWEHLQMLIPMCLNLGLSGVPFCGADVGGFAHDTEADLLVRWTQAAAFTPYFRNHSEIKCGRQEPWMFGEETEKLVAEAIRLRYRWLPQLYLLMEEAARDGIPVMRPMFLEFPDDPEAYRIADQFLFGSNVVVAPMLRPDTTHRALYLPAGEWVDYWTQEWISGGRYILAHAPMDRIPLYVKADSALLEENVRMSTFAPSEQLTLHLYISNAASSVPYRIYEDDGESLDREGSGYFEAEGTAILDKGGRLTVEENVLSSGWTPVWSKRQLMIHTREEITSASWNGEEKQVIKSIQGNAIQYKISLI